MLQWGSALQLVLLPQLLFAWGDSYANFSCRDLLDGVLFDHHLMLRDSYCISPELRAIPRALVYQLIRHNHDCDFSGIRL